ncbi:MAG TPA: gliding motility lipoprotein GldB [Sphingobacteriaceae bacterium]|nr:gliding motility lipoprotein GldB [Sphingobacteriaceae bacterium]
MHVSRTPLIYLFFLISLLLTSCGGKKRIDISHIKLDVHVERFDQSLNSLTSRNLSVKAPALKAQYGPFYNDFMEKMLGVGSTQDTAYYTNLRTVLNNRDYLELKSEVAKTYPDLSKTENELSDAFKHILYYYPQQKIPQLISFFSGFAYQVTIGQDYIGIGLDMFLGADSKFYPALRESIPAYLSRRYTPENIPPRVIEAFEREELFPERDEDRSLLAKMIYNGKILYFMNQVIPDASDSLLIGFTDKQLDWCGKNEANIWGYFLQENLLYETDYLKIQKYLTEAPFTPGIGEQNESAPKLGIWTGWQIVKKYMEKNPETTLQELMQNTDYQNILNKSGYKPK